jgi:hypothetical protein
MSYQEKNTAVSLFAHLLIVGYYLLNVFQMLQEGGLVPARVFGLWATVVAATILVNVIGIILTHIVLSIVEAIRTRKEPDERFIEDERDRLIDLKGSRIAYITFGFGVFLAMLTFVFGQPPLVMFSLIVFFGIAAEIVGNLSQIILYRRGV